MMPAVYYLYCLDFPNGKKYIGLSVNPDRRFRDHCRQATSERGRNPVHAAIRKHGLPRLHTLCMGDKAYIAELEIKTIAAFQTRDDRFGYNVCLGGELSPSVTPEVAAKISAAQKSARNLAHLAQLSAANKGQKRGPLSAETRAKLSAAGRGKTRGPMSLEQRAQMSAARKGRKIGPMPLERRAKLSAIHMGKSGTTKGRVHTLEARAKMSAALKGRKRSPEHSAKLSAALKGRKHTPETRAKMSASRTGQKRGPHSPERIAKMVAAKKGYKHSSETRAKMSAAGKGRPKSPEHVAAIKAAWDAKRQSSAQLHLDFG